MLQILTKALFVNIMRTESVLFLIYSSQKTNNGKVIGLKFASLEYLMVMVDMFVLNI